MKKPTSLPALGSTRCKLHGEIRCAGLLGILLTASAMTAGEPAIGPALDAKVQHTMRSWGAPGMVVVVVHNGQTVHAKGYGTRVVGEERSVDLETRVHIASHSKAVTATAIAMLVDEGKLSWDDRVVKHIPELALPDATVTDNVTIRDLLSHRAGLTPKGLGGFNNPAYGLQEMLAALKTEPLAGGFRAAQIYSQAGIALAGEIIARISGMSWERFVRLRIFEPLGMTHSYTSNRDLEQRFGAPSAENNIFLPANRRKGVVVRGDWRGIGTAALYAPAGGIVSTGGDLARWMTCLLRGGEYEGGRLLSRKALQHTWEPVVISDPALGNTVKPIASISAGSLGWVVVPYAGRRLLLAPGAFMGSVVALIPEERLGVAVATTANFTERARWEKLYLVNAVAMIAIDAALGLGDRDWSTEFDAAVTGQSAAPQVRDTRESTQRGQPPALDAGSNVQIKEATARVNGVDLFYRVAGKGPPLLLLHGLTRTGADWERFIADFASDYAVVVPDLRGHGRSTNPSGSYTHPEVARDVFALMDHLGYSSICAIGHSSGAITVITMAMAHPEKIKAMVMIGGGHRVPDKVRTGWTEWEFAQAPGAMRESLLQIHPGGEAQINTLVGYLHELGRNPDDPNFSPERLKTIKARTLFVCGDGDWPLDVAHEFHSNVAGSQLWIVPGQGHFPFWKEFGGSETAIQIFPRVVKEFLRSADAKRIKQSTGAKAYGAKQGYVQVAPGLPLHYRQVGTEPETVVIPGDTWWSDQIVSLAERYRLASYRFSPAAGPRSPP